MDIQIVSSTHIQRNLKSVLAGLHAPVLVVRDSVPTAVMLPYLEYQRLASLETAQLKQQMKDTLGAMNRQHNNVSDRELNRDIAEARRATRRR